MSRVFGDMDAQSIGVISEPIVQVLSLESIRSKFNDEDIIFVLVMSDGLIEGLKEQDIADELGKALSDQDRLDSKGMMEVLQDLIMKSSKSWLKIDMGYRDDISIAFQVIQS
jgi:serine/threonine protein phosphatase PrpC